MTILLSSVASVFGYAPAPSRLKAPGKPFESPAPELNRHEQQIAVLGPWMIATAGSAWCHSVTLVGAAGGHETPLIDPNIGVGFKLGGAVCGLVESALCVKYTFDYVDKARGYAAQKAKYHKQAERFQASDNVASRQAERERIRALPRAEPASVGEARQTEPLLDPGQATSESGVEEDDMRMQSDAMLSASLLADTEAYMLRRLAETKGANHAKAAVTTGFSFVRDGPLQWGSIGTHIATAVKIIGGTALENVIQVSNLAASVAAWGFGVVSGVSQVAQSIVDYRAAVREKRVAYELCERMEKCLDNDKLPAFENFIDGENNKYQGVLAGLQAQSGFEYRHIQGVYKALFERFNANHDAERKAQKILKGRAKLRAAYGIAATSIAIVGLALTATGIGGVVALGVLAAGGAVLGMTWIGLNIYRNMGDSKQMRAKAELEAKHKADANTLYNEPLVSLEDSFKTIQRENGYIAVALLARHLSGGKRDAVRNGASIAAIAATAVDASRNVGGLGAGVSAMGLRMRRKVAARFLRTAGMNPCDVRAVKEELAAGNPSAIGLQMLEQFLLGSAARAMPLLQAPPPESVPVV